MKTNHSCGFPTKEIEYFLWVLLRQARDACLKLREKELKPYGLSARQSAVLIAIKAIGDGATIGEVSNWLINEPHTVSSIISRMEKRGLVIRARDPYKKSFVRIFLTDKGKKSYRQAIKRESVHKIITTLSLKQREQLSYYLQTIRDKALEEFGDEEKKPYPPIKFTLKK